jgi:hypothetical protein
MRKQSTNISNTRLGSTPGEFINDMICNAVQRICALALQHAPWPRPSCWDVRQTRRLITCAIQHQGLSQGKKRESVVQIVLKPEQHRLCIRCDQHVGNRCRRPRDIGRNCESRSTSNDFFGRVRSRAHRMKPTSTRCRQFSLTSPRPTGACLDAFAWQESIHRFWN